MDAVVMRERIAELEAENEQLEALFQQTHGVRHDWVDRGMRLQRERDEARAENERLLNLHYAAQGVMERAGIKVVVAYPHDPTLSEYDRSLQAGGRVQSNAELATILVRERDEARAACAAKDEALRLADQALTDLVYDHGASGKLIWAQTSIENALSSTVGSELLARLERLMGCTWCDYRYKHGRTAMEVEAHEAECEHAPVRDVQARLEKSEKSAEVRLREIETLQEILTGTQAQLEKAKAERNAALKVRNAAESEYDTAHSAGWADCERHLSAQLQAMRAAAKSVRLLSERVDRALDAALLPSAARLYRNAVVDECAEHLSANGRHRAANLIRDLMTEEGNGT